MVREGCYAGGSHAQSCQQQVRDEAKDKLGGGSNFLSRIGYVGGTWEMRERKKCCVAVAVVINVRSL